MYLCRGPYGLFVDWRKDNGSDASTVPAAVAAAAGGEGGDRVEQAVLASPDGGIPHAVPGVEEAEGKAGTRKGSTSTRSKKNGSSGSSSSGNGSGSKAKGRRSKGQDREDVILRKALPAVSNDGGCCALS